MSRRQTATPDPFAQDKGGLARTSQRNRWRSPDTIAFVRLPSMMIDGSIEHSNLISLGVELVLGIVLFL